MVRCRSSRIVDDNWIFRSDKSDLHLVVSVPWESSYTPSSLPVTRRREDNSRSNLCHVNLHWQGKNATDIDLIDRHGHSMSPSDLNSPVDNLRRRSSVIISLAYPLSWHSRSFFDTEFINWLMSVSSSRRSLVPCKDWIGNSTRSDWHQHRCLRVRVQREKQSSSATLHHVHMPVASNSIRAGCASHLTSVRRGRINIDTNQRVSLD